MLLKLVHPTLLSDYAVLTASSGSQDLSLLVIRLHLCVSDFMIQQKNDSIMHLGLLRQLVLFINLRIDLGEHALQICLPLDLEEQNISISCQNADCRNEKKCCILPQPHLLCSAPQL